MDYLEKVIYPKESYKIMGACYEVYREMGCGFLESIYQECLEIEMRNQSIPFEAQKKISVIYKNEKLVKGIIKPDIICYGKIIIEIKAVSQIINEHRAQLQNYLNATDFKLGIFVNFGHYPKLESERFVFTESKKCIN